MGTPPHKVRRYVHALTHSQWFLHEENTHTLPWRYENTCVEAAQCHRYGRSNHKGRLDSSYVQIWRGYSLHLRLEVCGKAVSLASTIQYFCGSWKKSKHIILFEVCPGTVRIEGKLRSCPLYRAHKVMDYNKMTFCKDQKLQPIGFDVKTVISFLLPALYLLCNHQNYNTANCSYFTYIWWEQYPGLKRDQSLQ